MAQQLALECSNAKTNFLTIKYEPFKTKLFAFLSRDTTATTMYQFVSKSYKLILHNFLLFFARNLKFEYFRDKIHILKRINNQKHI